MFSPTGNLPPTSEATSLCAQAAKCNTSSFADLLAHGGAGHDPASPRAGCGSALSRAIVDMEFCGVSEGDQEIHQAGDKPPSERPSPHDTAWELEADNDPRDVSKRTAPGDAPQGPTKKPCLGRPPQANTPGTRVPSPTHDSPMSTEVSVSDPAVIQPSVQSSAPIFVLQDRVQLRGLEKNPHLNGRRGKVCSPAGAGTGAGAVQVRLHDGSTHGVGVLNLVLLPDPVPQPGFFEVGDSVRICGLMNRRDLNQAWGTVSSPHAGANAKRFTVRLDNGNVVAVPVSNLIHAPVRANGSDEDLRSNAPDTFCASNTNPGWGMKPPAKLGAADLEALRNRIRELCQKTPRELVDIMRNNLREGEVLLDPLEGKDPEELLLVVAGTYATPQCKELQSLTEAEKVGGIIRLKSGPSLTKAVSLVFLDNAERADGTPAIASAEAWNSDQARHVAVVDVLAGNWPSGRSPKEMLEDLMSNIDYSLAATVLEVWLLVNSQCVLRVIGVLNRQAFGGWVRFEAMRTLDPNGQAAWRIQEEHHPQVFQDQGYVSYTNIENAMIHDEHNQVVGQLLVGAALTKSRVGVANYLVLKCKCVNFRHALEDNLLASADPEGGSRVLDKIMALSRGEHVSHCGALSTAARAEAARITQEAPDVLEKISRVVRQLHHDSSSLGGDASWRSRQDYFKDLAAAALPREGEDTSVLAEEARKLINEQVWWGNLGVSEREELRLAVVKRNFPRVHELYADNKELNREAGSLGGDAAAEAGLELSRFTRELFGVEEDGVNLQAQNNGDAAAESGLELSRFTRELFGVEEDGVNLQAQNNGDAYWLSQKKYFEGLLREALHKDDVDGDAPDPRLEEMHTLIKEQTWFGNPGRKEREALSNAVVQRDFKLVTKLYADNKRLNKDAGFASGSANSDRHYGHHDPITDAQLEEVHNMTQNEAAAFLKCSVRKVSRARKATGK